MMDAEEKLHAFSAREEAEKVVAHLLEALKRRRTSGFVFGAGGGVDSFVCAALCLQVRSRDESVSVQGLQLNDARIHGEVYNSGIYRRMGVELIQQDITDEIRDWERESYLLPRLVTGGLARLILRHAPEQVRRRIILAVVKGTAPQPALLHFRRLTIPHRIRIARLREYAERENGVLIVCTNLTEARLGFFVESGVDDLAMGDYAPLAGYYKTQVYRLAEYLDLPAGILGQQPSPGFGGVSDADIIGPYAAVDHVLSGFAHGCSNETIAERLAEKHGSLFRNKPDVRAYVQFLREMQANSQDKSNA
jgi:NAD+ synthase